MWITLLFAIGVFLPLIILVDRTNEKEIPLSEPIPPIIGEKKNDRRRRIFENYSDEDNKYNDDAVYSVIALFSLIIKKGWRHRSTGNKGGESLFPETSPI